MVRMSWILKRGRLVVFLVVVVPGCPKLTARPRGHDCAAYLVWLPGSIGAFRGLICGFGLLITDKYSE